MTAAPRTEVDVAVVGVTLAGMAAAARLAKAGHRVALITDGGQTGGLWAAHKHETGALVDEASSVLTLPAAWRDLFRKSGRPLEAELARSGWELVPAPPTVHRFADGSELILPTDRGAQLATLRHRYGPAVAARWRDLIDDLDEVWQRLRPLGLEAELTGRAQLTRAATTVLKPQLSLTQLADRFGHPHLIALVRDLAAPLGSTADQTPGFAAAVELSVQRRFGRWCVHRTAEAPSGRPLTLKHAAAPRPVRDHGRVLESGRTSALIEILSGRQADRQVIMIDQPVLALRPDRTGAPAVITTDGRIDARALIWAGDALPDLARLLAEIEPGPTAGDDHRPALAAFARTFTRLRPARAPMIIFDRQPTTAADQLRLDDHDGSVETIHHRDDAAVLISTTRRTEQGMITVTHDYARSAQDWRRGIAWQGAPSQLVRPAIRGPLPGLFVAGPWSAAGPGLAQTLLSGALASYAGHDWMSTPS